MDQVERLKRLVSTLKNNEKNVPKEKLETIYREPYQRLRNEIKELGTAIANNQIVLGPAIRSDNNGRNVLEAIQKWIQHEKENGLCKKLGGILVHEYDVKKFLKEVDNLREKINEICEKEKKLEEEKIEQES